MKKIAYLCKIFTIILGLNSCKEFLDPDLGIVLNEKDLFVEFNDYRAAMLGLYSIQQELAEQILILGELRGDLLEITDNADRDLMDIYNFKISPENRYASPEKFYKLIVNCNNLLKKIVQNNPGVLDPRTTITNYDRLYGEVQCMRAWAYFNAVRIFGEVPYIYPFLDSMDEIESYIKTGQTLIAPERIIFDIRGYYNDTLRNDTVVLDMIYLDMDAIIDSFTTVLETNVRSIGLQYHLDNNDLTWQVTTWSRASYHALLAQMYLFRGDYTQSMKHLDYFLYNYESATQFIRYGLDNRFASNNWRNIFAGIDQHEHIFSVWYGRNYRQQNNLQYYFSNRGVNRYMLKPTARAIQYWEGMFKGFQLLINTADPSKTFTSVTGTPGDFHRGYGVSYMYFKGNEPMHPDTVQIMLNLKRDKNDREAYMLMGDVDTVVYKYTIFKVENARDAFIPLYRAAGMHLYAAEIYAMWEFMHPGNEVYPLVQRAFTILNNGNYTLFDQQRRLGVRGRVGFGSGAEAVNVGNINYLRDPSTNEVTGYIDLTPTLLGKQLYAVELILDERARELAFEGERFFDLMRVAKRTGNPAFLADKVAAKFSGQKAEEIRAKLMNEKNWYLELP